MATLIVHLVVSTLAVLAGAYVLKGVKVDGVQTALIVAIVLGVLNTFVRPILVILTFPVTVLTLGLFLLVINALMIQLAAKLVSGFHVDSIWWAMAYSLVVSIVGAFLYSLVQSQP